MIPEKTEEQTHNRKNSLMTSVLTHKHGRDHLSNFIVFAT